MCGHHKCIIHIKLNCHCQPLQSTAVLAGRDDYTHDCSPRDDRGYNHPPAALLVLNWWTMSLSGVKLGNMSWITLRGSTSGPPLGAFGTLGVSPRLIPSGMIKSIIPSFSSRQCYIIIIYSHSEKVYDDAKFCEIIWRNKCDSIENCLKLQSHAHPVPLVPSSNLIWRVSKEVFYPLDLYFKTST